MRRYFTNTLLILQQQHYKPQAFLHIYKSRFFKLRSYSSRQQVDRTTKLISLICSAFLIYICISIFVAVSIPIYITTAYMNYAYIIYIIIFFAAFPLHFPLLISPFIVIFTPFQYIISQRRYQKTKKLLTTRSDLIVISIAWSYGKTSMKEILKNLLSTAYHVLVVPWNINTPLGICKYIWDHLTSTHQILLLEMGETHVWDIKEICDIIPPSIGIITGITEQHIASFHSIDNVISTIFELTSYIPDTGALYCNSESEHVTTGLRRHIPTSKTYPIYTYTRPQNISYLPRLQGISFVYKDRILTCPLLGIHHTTALTLACEVAENLGIPRDTCQKIIQKLPHIPHRLEPIHNPYTHITVIDDSYNGNLQGVMSAIDLLNNYTCQPWWHKWILTPWLTELGHTSAGIHTQIWQFLAKSVDYVILISSSWSAHIINWLLSAGFPEHNIFVYNTAQEAHRSLPSLLHTHDIILFQNDIPDFAE